MLLCLLKGGVLRIPLVFIRQNTRGHLVRLLCYPAVLSSSDKVHLLVLLLLGGFDERGGVCLSFGMILHSVNLQLILGCWSEREHLLPLILLLSSLLIDEYLALVFVVRANSNFPKKSLRGNHLPVAFFHDALVLVV